MFFLALKRSSVTGGVTTVISLATFASVFIILTSLGYHGLDIRSIICRRCKNINANKNAIHMEKINDHFNILLWNSTSGWIIPEGPLSERVCDVTNCWITHDKSKVNQSHAVVFYPYNDNIKKVPHYKTPGQLWVYFEKEPPKEYGMRYLEPYNDVIDTTMTYVRDSDIPVPYGKYTPLTPDDDFLTRSEPSNFAKDRKNRVLWFVSHCQAKSLRDEYVKELKKYIPVDVYGRCGDLKCRTETDHQCFDILKSYKFYLAFENMICEDYITEKLWRTLNKAILPIVLGGATYSDILPPNSYLDVKNFTSPKRLAEYLTFLARYDDAYNRYFSWRKKYKIIVPNVSCELCKYLNRGATPTKRRIRLHDWWAKDKCVEPSKYYENSYDNIGLKHSKLV